ncbi:MAG: helix-turn-helix domain-containing protein [Clostridia bacterium]|nr:helix-turn-helix domain-containing protein [Clostridia bacterium]
MELTNKIKNLRTARRITQDALAEALGVSAQAVSKWERGLAMPDVSLLPELAVYFGVTLDELFGLSEEKEYDRIQNVIWDKRLLSHEELDQAERWLDEKIASGYRTADCHRLKADLYNHQAGFLHEAAAGEAMAALAIDPDCKGAHGELNTGLHGYVPDWCVRNHHKEIDYYKDFIKAHPRNWRAHLWLLDNLIDDGRFAEAEETAESLAKIDGTFRTSLYRGLILWHQGKRPEAHAVWDKMLAEFENDWLVWFSLGDVAAMELRYEDAAAMYRKGIEVQEHPRYVDGFESIAQICEVCGDYAAAIAALEEELEVLKTDWDTTKGETADSVRREIRRLKARQSKKA